MKHHQFLLASLLLLTGCSADKEFSEWPCRFEYDNSIHSDATLASALDKSSRGVFCLITESTRGGVKYLNFQNSSGLISEPVAESYEEAQKQFILGLNNGIIVGFQTLNTDSPHGGFMAYDQQCPNCVRNENNTVNPNYRIQMSDNGIATCGKCGKKYDLNNGGIILNGNKDDTGLEKYVANTLGPFSWVSVRRR